MRCACKKTASIKDTLIILFFIFLCLIFISMCSKDDDKAADKTADVKATECTKDDLSCLGEKGLSGASVYCKKEIEKFAKYSVKWTDTSLFDMKFSRYRWKDQPAGIITYIGDKVEFQNGFGAFTPMTYECDLMPDNKTVLDARVYEGRLP